MTASAHPIAPLRTLGRPEELLGDPVAEPPFRAANAHIHLPPNFSAFDTIHQTIELARDQHVDVLGPSNYYDYALYADFAAAARRHAIFPLFGIEILSMQDDLRSAGVRVNDPGNPGKTYLCGKGITRFLDSDLTPRAATLLQRIRRDDARRMAEVVARLAQHFARHGIATGLDHESVKDRIVQRHGVPRSSVYLQERHAAQAFQEALFARVPLDERPKRLAGLLDSPVDVAADDHVAVQNAIRARLMKAGKPAFVEESYVGFDDAIQLVLQMAGIPAYPVLADGADPVCEFEATPDQLVENVRARGIHAAELIPIRNTPEALRRYVTALRRAGLLVTAGTEHNTLDRIPLTPTCLRGQPIPDDLRAIFDEGACVVAAHQYCVAMGQPGFVDERGVVVGGDPSRRIEELQRLGAAVIRRSRAQSASRTEACS